MKLAGEAQAELIRIVAWTAALAAVGFLGYRLYKGTAGAVSDAVSGAIDSVKSAVGGAVDYVADIPNKVSQAAHDGGEQWLQGYKTDSNGQYTNPLINPDGMDFSAGNF